MAQLSSERALAQRSHVSVRLEPSSGGLTLKKAFRLYKQAKERAEREERTARARAAAVVRRARERAYRLGFAQGTHDGLSQALSHALTHHEMYARTVARANEDCLSVALGVAREVLGEVLVVSPDAVTARIERALLSLSDLRSVKIYVHESQQEQVRRSLREGENALPCTVYPSEDLVPGDAIIETISGTVEIRWEEHFESIRERLTKRLRESLGGESSVHPS